MGCWRVGKIVIWFSDAARRAFGTGKMARMEQGLRANLSEKQDDAPLFHVTVPPAYLPARTYRYQHISSYPIHPSLSTALPSLPITAVLHPSI